MSLVIAFNTTDSDDTFPLSTRKQYAQLRQLARTTVMKELRGVIEFDGSYINYRHLALLCDLMTDTRMAIARHGINRTDAGALMRCSSEETFETLMEAAAVGEKNDCHGIAGNVMFDQIAPMGTGEFDVALDMDMLKNVIVNHLIPVRTFAASASLDGGITPGQVAMTSDDSNSPMWNTDSSFKGETAAFSPLVSNSGTMHRASGISPSEAPEAMVGDRQPFPVTVQARRMRTPRLHLTCRSHHTAARLHLSARRHMPHLLITIAIVGRLRLHTRLPHQRSISPLLLTPLRVLDTRPPCRRSVRRVLNTRPPRRRSVRRLRGTHQRAHRSAQHLQGTLRRARRSALRPLVVSISSSHSCSY